MNQDEVVRTNDPEWDKKFNDFWLPLISTNRQLDVEKIKNEFHDFDFVIEQLPKVYSHITYGRLSKHMYEADTVISEHDEVCHESCQEDYEEQEQNFDEEIIELEKRIAFNKKKLSQLKKLEKQYAERLKIECKSKDKEAAHSIADKLIIEFLNKAGFGKLVKEFDKIDRWYA